LYTKTTKLPRTTDILRKIIYTDFLKESLIFNVEESITLHNGKAQLLLHRISNFNAHTKYEIKTKLSNLTFVTKANFSNFFYEPDSNI
jgi:hypothetical protein